MNIGKYIPFLRQSKQLNWHRDQPLSRDPEQHSSTKIVEFQDRWTMTPSRVSIRLNDAGSSTVQQHRS